jgi:hypothetical protein
MVRSDFGALVAAVEREKRKKKKKKEKKQPPCLPGPNQRVVGTAFHQTESDQQDRKHGLHLSSCYWVFSPIFSA